MLSCCCKGAEGLLNKLCIICSHEMLFKCYTWQKSTFKGSPKPSVEISRTNPRISCTVWPAESVMDLGKPLNELSSGQRAGADCGSDHELLIDFKNVSHQKILKLFLQIGSIPRYWGEDWTSFRGSTCIQPATEPCLVMTSVIARPRLTGGILRMLLNPKPATPMACTSVKWNSFSLLPGVKVSSD